MSCACGKQAVVAVDSGRLPLCMDCYQKFSEINARQIEQLQRMTEQAERDLYLVTGMPLPPHLQPKVPVIVRQQVNNPITVTGGTVGIINTGAIQQAHVSISGVADESVRAVLAALAAAFEHQTDSAVAQRTEAVELVGGIADEARKPAGERRLGIVKTMVMGLGQLASGVKAANEIWLVAEPMLKKFFHLS